MALLQNVRSKARHRGLTPWQLVQKIRRLEQGLDETTCKVIELATENDVLKAERSQLESQLDKAGIDYSGALDDARQAREERDEWRNRALALQARFGAQLAAEDNAHRVDVPPMVRDTSAIEDQATGPIDVRTLREAANAGLLGPVTDPGHVHTH
jgi:outer membrane murein-binding lipoprotein Lpp